MTKSSFSTPAFLLVLLLTLSAQAGTLSRVETLNLPASGVERLILGNGSGLLECLGEDREDVQVELIFKAKSRKREKAQNLLDKANLGVVREGGKLRLEPDLPGGSIWVDIIVRLPLDLDVRARVGSGELSLRDLLGRLDLEAGSGSVEGRDLGGKVEVKLDSGELRLRDVTNAVYVRAGRGDVILKRIESCEVRASSGDVEIHSVFGPCRVKTRSGDILVRKVAGPVELESGSGDIKASGLMDRVRLETGSGDQVIRGLGREGQDLRIGATSGDLDLSFLVGASYELELETSSGEVDARLPMEVRKITRRRLSARIGDGRDRARIETSSGDIRIRATEETP